MMSKKQQTSKSTDRKNFKQNPQGKRVIPKYVNKWDDQIVDLFPGQNEKNHNKQEEQFMFNRVPLVKQEKEKLLQSSKKTKKQQLKKKAKFTQLSDSEDEIFDYKLEKKQKSFVDEESFFDTLKSDFTSYFMMSKDQIEKIEKVPELSLQVGCLVLCAVCDKGPNGKYLVANLHRNKKVYISSFDLSEDGTSDAKKFNLGEYLVAVVVTSLNEKKVQVSLKPSQINKGLNFEDIFVGQNIPGTIKSIEDYIISIDLYCKDTCIAFIQKNEQKFDDLDLKRPYLFTVISKNENKKMVTLQLIDQSKFISLPNKDDLLGLDLQHAVKPGNLVKCTILKILPNGILVRFLKIFNGFIFMDNLEQDPSFYKVKAKIDARIIGTNTENKQIFLSPKHVNLDVYQTSNFELGNVYSGGFTVEKILFGHSYLVKPKNEDFNCFLHKLHLDNPDQDLKEGETVNKFLKIKEINYFSHYPIITTKQELMQKVLSWPDIKTGQILKATIEEIDNVNKRLKVSISKHITTFIDELNISDQPEINKFKLSKQIKVGNTVKVKVISVNQDYKSIKVTMKPIFLQEAGTIKFLENIKDIEENQPYYGYISKVFDFGFKITFFNDISGILNFRDIQEHEIDQSQFKLGQTVKVYVCFIDQQKNNIGLSLSTKGGFEIISSQNYMEKIKSQLSDFNPKLNQKQFDKISIGSIFEYLPDFKAMEEYKNNDFLILNSTQGIEHTAIISKEHLSDYNDLYQPLFQYYKKQKKQTIKCRVIEKYQVENKNIIILSAKPSLINEPKLSPIYFEDLGPKKIYTAYVSKQSKKSIHVTFNSQLKSIINIMDLLQHQNTSKFAQGDSLIVKVKKISDVSEKKFTLHLASITDIQTQNIFTTFHPFLGYLDQEFLLFKKFITKNQKKWQTYKIGNYVLAKVMLVKDYGIILSVEVGVTGFITNDNIKNNINELPVDSEVFCRILDIDYEKEILDLIQVPQTKQKESLLKDNSYNHTLLQEHQIFDKQFLELEVMLVKDNYSVCQTKQEKIIVILMTKILKQVQQQVVNGEKIKKAKIINKQLLTQNFQKSDVNFLNKSNYLPICDCFISQTPEVKKEEIENNQDHELDKFSYQIGHIVEGKVLKIKSTFYTVQLENKQYAILHKSQVDQDAKLTSKQTVVCKVIQISQKTNHSQIFLTNLKDQMALPEGKVSKNLIYPDDEENFKKQFTGKILTGVIKSINVNSNHPIYAELSINHYGYCDIFKGICPFVKITNINQLKDKFQIGQQVKLKILKIHSIKNIEFTLNTEDEIGSQDFQIGDIVYGKVINKNPNGLRVQINHQVYGNVNILEISDEWLSNPLNKYQKNDFITGRVIALPDTNSDQYVLSLRDSFLNQKNWTQALSPLTGNTVMYKKYFAETEKLGDLRARIYKLGLGSLRPNMIFIGYVNACNNNGCFIKIGHNLTVKSNLNQLSDQYLKEPEKFFTKNKIVIGRFIDVKENGKIDANLQESAVVGGYNLDLDKLKTGLTVKGIVNGFLKGKASVSIQNCKFRGTLSLKDALISEDQQAEYIEKIFPVGTQITAKIIKFQKEPKIKIKLGTKPQYFEEMIEEELQEEKDDYIYNLIESIHQKWQEEEQKGQDIQQKEIQISNQLDASISDIEEENQDDQQIEKENKSSDTSQMEEEVDQDVNDEEIQEDMEAQEDAGEEEEEEDEILSDQSFIENDEPISNKRKSQRKKEIEKRKKEEDIRSLEQRALQENNAPQSDDDYEKLILKNPNSSFIWIQYVAYKMQNSGIEEAREVVERALRVIQYKNEIDKLNMWTAYMNLEFNFGSEKTLVNVFKRALDVCKPKSVYFNMLEIYRKAEKFDLLIELSKTMMTKFKHSSKAWLEHFKNVAAHLKHQKSQDVEEDSSLNMKNLLQRSLQCLKKKKNIIIMTHYARLMYQIGDQEKGRTTFEAIISNYPKRTDIWNCYIDSEIKYSNQDSARQLFERCINLSLKPRKMKFFFKKYFVFEMSHGNKELAEDVKNKASQYVEKLNDDIVQIDSDQDVDVENIENDNE